jgi:membrane-associated phospholipid phosphatase
MPAALIGLALAWGVMLVFGGMEFDRGLLVLGYTGGSLWLTETARIVTRLGDGPVLIGMALAIAIWLAWRRDWRDAVVLVAITLSGRLLVELQKAWTARLRPDANEHLVQVSNLSFPSGHAANTTIVLLTLAVLLPADERGRFFAVWLAVLLALLVGVSRVMLGVHWPSDVIGGWSFGLFWTLLLLRLTGHSIEDGTSPPPGFAPR